MELDLKEKRVLIVGASKGIGRGIVEAFPGPIWRNEGLGVCTEV